MNMQDWYEGARKRFGFDAWPRPSREDAQFHARQMSLDLKEVEATWHREQRIPWGHKGYADYYEERENGRHRIMVRVSEYPSNDEARMALLREISFSMAVTLPRLDERAIWIGDIGFTGHGEVDTGIIFVRHNMLVDVRSIGDEALSVREFAGAVDNFVIGTVKSQNRNR